MANNLNIKVVRLCADCGNPDGAFDTLAQCDACRARVCCECMLLGHVTTGSGDWCSRVVSKSGKK